MIMKVNLRERNRLEDRADEGKEEEPDESEEVLDVEKSGGQRIRR